MTTQDLTIGVEEEFFLVDPTGSLVNSGPEAVADSDDRDVDLKPELTRTQVESATGILRTGPEVVEELTDLRSRLAEGAAAQGALLIAAGTAPHEQDVLTAVGPGTRYHRIARHVGRFVFGGATCGCHVHVGIPDQVTAIKVANHLRPWLPTLLALCANSPFNDGEDTGYASARHLLWGRWPSAGPPPYVDSPREYDDIVEGMLAVGAALDRKMVYWDVRPSELQPTVEIRVSDVAGTPREAGLLAVLVRCLVRDALDATSPAPRVPTEIISAAQWRASKDGHAAVLPDPVSGAARSVQAILGDLVRAHTPRLRASGELAFVESTLAWMGDVGDGARRQREAFAKAGSLDDVVRMLAAQTSLSGLDHG